MMRYGTFALSAALFSALAQTPQEAPRPVVSPELKPDKTVTFRFRSPSAHEVLLAREGAQRIPMQKGEDGVWTVTTGPLAPDLYGYSFIADGVSLMDPVNPLIKPNLLNPQSMVRIPGEGLPWEVTNIPHGAVQHRFYHSKIVGDDRDFYVYTPPDYDPAAKKQYPTLYLLHGYSDDASGWTAVGQAHIILDNLIAQRKAQPMLVVMTLGYGAPEIVSRTGPAFRDPELRQRSFDRFRDSLFEEVMPMVEKEYRVAKDRTMRAIAGLSMGGAETLYVGLNNLNRFAYIGAFSSGGLGEKLAAQFPNLDGSTANSQLRLFWISCGVDDRLLESNRKFVEFMKSRSVEVKLRETPGAHTWMVWRRNLSEFAPMLFQKKSS
jgi:enterochelin esterase-like enzyme